MNPADWYPDPFGRYEYRFHNGRVWTADVSTNGVRYVDPLGASPAPGPGSGPSLPPREPRRDGLATAAMVLGIVGLTISWVPLLFVAGAVCAVLALIFGTVALRRGKPANRPFAITGLLTGGAGLLMVGVGVWTTSVVIDEVDEYTNPPPARVEITRCAVVDARLVVAGSIENLGNREADFRVVVDVSGVTIRDRRIAFRAADVAAGEAITFGGTVTELGRLGGDDRPTCVVDDVTGPLPFGLDIEPD